MENKKIALFIDAENISSDYAKFIFDKVSSYGEIIIKRIYADWTNEQPKNWKDNIGEYSITAIQCFTFASKKNSSDMYLTTDIAEILYEKNIDIFIIVSSDSDYTSWVQKIREKGKQALGFGELKTIKSYVNSFNEFFYLNVKEKDEQLNKELVHDLNVIVDNLIEEKGIAEYPQISIGIRRKYADFIPSNYGCKRFKELIDKYLSITTNKYKKNIKDDNKSYYLSEEK